MVGVVSTNLFKQRYGAVFDSSWLVLGWLVHLGGEIQQANENL